MSKVRENGGESGDSLGLATTWWPLNKRYLLSDHQIHSPNLRLIQPGVHPLLIECECLIRWYFSTVWVVNQLKHVLVDLIGFV